MTGGEKWKLVVPSVGIVTIVFACGVFVGNYKESAALYITRPEFNQHVAENQIRLLRDSLTRAAQYTDEVKRLDRLERITYKVACHFIPTECSP